MKLLDDNLFAEGVDETEALDESAEKDEDFLKSLEKKAVEIEGESDDSSQGQPT